MISSDVTSAVYETSSERRRVTGFLERRGVSVGGSTAGIFLFGSLFVAAGVLIALVGCKVIPVKEQSVHAPYWVITICGALFGLGGLIVWSMAWRQFAENRRQREIAQRSGEPALLDYAWSQRGYAPPRWTPAIKAILGAIFFTAFMTPFNWWAFVAKGPWPVKIIVLLFDLFLVAVWWRAVLKIGRALKFGGSRIEYAHFPYRLNQPIVIRWQPASDIGESRKSTFTLRCVEERVERRGSGKNRQTHLVQEKLWSGTWRSDAPQQFAAGQWSEHRFELPADVPSTQLSAEKPIFWEFEVKLDLPGFDFEEKYLVPVYGG